MSEKVEMRRLASKLIDGLATKTEVDRLADLVQSSPELRDELVRTMQCEAALDEIHSRDLLALELGTGEQVQSGDAIARLGIERSKTSTTISQTAELSASTPIRTERASWRQLAGALFATPVWAVAAMLLLSVGIFLFWPRTHATLVATENVEWNAGSHFEIGERVGGEWLSLQSGVVQLAFDSTAAMKLEGPARFRATADGSCELQLGSAIAYVPPAAVGFAVDTPAMRVIDRGTSFRIEVAKTNETALQVLEGIVDAESKSAGKTHRMVAGDVATLTGEPSEDLQVTSAEHLVPRTSSRIAFRAKHVPSLGHSGFKGNDRCYVFLERHHFTLPHNLAVNLMDSGKHSTFDVASGDLQAGTRVDCYLVHSAPRGKRHVVEGTISFRGEILGVLSSSDRLNATNALFGSPWLLRCQHPERGLEGTPNRNSDRIEISDDRHTLRLSVRTESIDQLRVLVKSSPEG